MSRANLLSTVPTGDVICWIDERQTARTKDDLRDQIGAAMALADELGLPLVGALLDSALRVMPADVHY